MNPDTAPLAMSSTGKIHAVRKDKSNMTYCGISAVGWARGWMWTNGQGKDCFNCKISGGLQAVNPKLELRCTGCGETVDIQNRTYTWRHTHFEPVD